MQNFLTNIWSGHSLQFIVIIVIFVIQTFTFIEQGAWKKSGTFYFIQWGYQALHCVYDVFLPVFQCHALKRHIGLLTKRATLFLHLIS